MAMTKAEKAEMEDLRIRAALNWPSEPPKPIDLDVARAGAEKEWLHLWWFTTGGLYDSGAVSMGVTNGHNHSRSDHTDEQIQNRYKGGSRISLSQGAGGPWFASMTDALAALRHAQTLRCAKILAEIDQKIEEAK